MNRPFERRAVLDGAVDCAAPHEIAAHLVKCAEARAGCFVTGLSGPYLAAMASDEALREAFLEADVLLPDGQGLVWGARLLGVPVGKRLAMPDLCEQLLAEGNARGWKVFLYGAAEATNRSACENIRQRFPGLPRVEGQQGYGQGGAEEAAVIEHLKEGGFHLLLVARPSPEKERFLKRACAGAGVVGLAVGGYAEILAGRRSRAPRFLQALGYEWLWRTLQEPRRLARRVAWANLRFAGKVLWAHLRQPAKRPWWAGRAVQSALILLALTSAYAGCIGAPYHFDDPEYIQHNPAIRSFGALRRLKVLTQRKLFWWSQVLCYRFSKYFGVHRPGHPDVRVFRAWNIAAHFFAALALMALLERLVRARERRRAGRENAANLAAGGAVRPDILLPPLAAGLFAVHPLATEAVTYLSGRGNSQGGMFYLLGLYFAALAFERLFLGAASSSSESAPPDSFPARKKIRTEWRWPGWFVPAGLSLACAAGAVLSKESYLSFPAAAGALYFCFYAPRGSEKRLAPTVSRVFLAGLAAAGVALAAGLKFRAGGWLGPAAAAALGILFLGWRWGERARARRVGLGWAFWVLALAGVLSVFAIFPYAYRRLWVVFTGARGEDPLRALATQANALPVMLLKTVWPLGLNIDHHFPTFLSFREGPALRGALVVGALAVFSAFGLWRRWWPAFAAALALISIAPTNSLIERGDVASERNFYLAAASGAVAWAWLVTSLPARLAQRRGSGAEAHRAPPEAALWGGVLGVMVLGPFAALCFRRNAEYRDPYTLWSAAVERAPDKIRALHNLGLAAAKKRRYGEADEAFQRAIESGERKRARRRFRPDEVVERQAFFLSYADLAELQYRRYLKDPLGIREGAGQVDALYRRGLRESAYHPDVAHAYARWMLRVHRARDAARVLRATLQRYPWADYLLGILGEAELRSGQFARARAHLRAALDVRTPSVLGWSEGLRPAERARVLAPLARAEAALGASEASTAHFREVLRLDAHAAYGLLRSQPPLRDEALAALRRAIGEHPVRLYLRELLKRLQAEQSRRRKAAVKKKSKA